MYLSMLNSLKLLSNDEILHNKDSQTKNESSGRHISIIMFMIMWRRMRWSRQLGVGR